MVIQLAMKPQFTTKDIENFARKRIEVLIEVIENILIETGEEFVRTARVNGEYTDRTSNLRGSIGYSVLRDGQTIAGNFEGSKEGQEKAGQLIDKVAADYPTGYILIVVAGMDYAAYVEAKGYDVITGSSLKAESTLTRSINRLRKQISKINK